MKITKRLIEDALISEEKSSNRDVERIRALSCALSSYEEYMKAPTFLGRAFHYMDVIANVYEVMDDSIDNKIRKNMSGLSGFVLTAVAAITSEITDKDYI